MAQYYSSEEINHILESYRRIFPKYDSQSWSKLSSYMDIDRKRAWGCMTSNFHEISVEKYQAFSDMHRRSVLSDCAEECGKLLSDLAIQSGCGYSLGFNPYADKALLSTFDKNTEKIVILVGHDWYPIDDRYGGRSSPLEKSTFMDRVKGPFSKYHKGLPSPEEFKRSRTGLLFINIVPDFRHPGASLEGKFPFPPHDCFNYDSCLDGFVSAIQCINPRISVSHAVLWGAYVWKYLSKNILDDRVRMMSMTNASKLGGKEGFKWNAGGATLTLHPFKHPARSNTKDLSFAYEEMWKKIIL